MDEIREVLRARFPLLFSLRLCQGGASNEELAAFMGILLAAMEQSPRSPFCFVFPRKSSMAPLSATLYALGKFALDFPRLAEEYARRGFDVGNRVKLAPQEKVFVFDGVWPGHETNFRLRLYNDKWNTRFNLPVSEILRIEPTERKIPKGREEDIRESRKPAPPSVLDRLIGTRTYGNPSLMRNYLLYLGGRTDLEEFSSRFSLTNGDACETIHDLIRPGEISESGEIRRHDQYQAAGEPLMAVSSRLDFVAAACVKAPERSLVVVVDGARRFTDLAQFDAIARTQNLIIVAESEEDEKLQHLHNRGCDFWRFSLADLELGGEHKGSGSTFTPVFRAARNEAAFSATVTPCHNADLEEASRYLQAAQAGLNETEGDETHAVIRRLYALLMHCAVLIAPPGDEERRDLRQRASTILLDAGDRALWLPDSVAMPLNDASAKVIRAIEDPALGVSKGDMLGTLLADMADRRVAIVARSAASRRSIEGWLASRQLNIPVHSAASLADGSFFDFLVCTAWPGKQSFQLLHQLFASPGIGLLAYSFESEWLTLFERRRHQQRSALVGITASAKSVLLGLPDGTFQTAEVIQHIGGAAAAAPTTVIDFEDQMTRKGAIPVGAVGEETAPATLVAFAGDAYTFLTDTFKVPVLSDLLAGGTSGNRIQRKRLSDLRAGDLLVFREPGRRDVIQSLADAELGTKALVIRERAARWHNALRHCGLDEDQLMRELEGVKCTRTLQTVRGWLADDSIIGPQTKEDLEAIAYAVADPHLLEQVSDIWEAVHTLKGEHLRAGIRLSRILLEKLPGRLHEIQEGRTRIDIDNTTSAWIVQVEHISEAIKILPRSYVNVLLWESE
jgi:hypothetical protein